MRKFIIIFSSLILANCSLNKDSKYSKDEDASKRKDQKKLSQVLEKSDDIIKMTYDEYKIYIDDYTKKSKYPDISK